MKMLFYLILFNCISYCFADGGGQEWCFVPSIISSNIGSSHVGGGIAITVAGAFGNSLGKRILGPLIAAGGMGVTIEGVSNNYGGMMLKGTEEGLNCTGIIGKYGLGLADKWENFEFITGPLLSYNIMGGEKREYTYISNGSVFVDLRSEHFIERRIWGLFSTMRYKKIIWDCNYRHLSDIFIYSTSIAVLFKKSSYDFDGTYTGLGLRFMHYENKYMWGASLVLELSIYGLTFSSE
jgi:hypothetical protein